MTEIDVIHVRVIQVCIIVILNTLSINILSFYAFPVLHHIHSTSTLIHSISMLSLSFNTGITLSGLESPLTVGQSATITCTTNIEVSFIEWRDETSAVLSSATDQTVEYTIPLVRDDLQGLQYTCRAVSGTTVYTETVEIQVVSKFMSRHFA